MVSISSMFAEVNKLVARYGVDPGDFTLVPFGGAGPMMGCLLARELGMRKCYGAASAWRGQCARWPSGRGEERHHSNHVHRHRQAASLPALRAALDALREEALRWLRDRAGLRRAGGAQRFG